MRTFGFGMMALGAFIAVSAFMMDTTVATPGDYLAARTHNLGLLQQQMMVLQTGLAVFIAGSFFGASNAPASSSPRDATVQDQTTGTVPQTRPSPESSAETEQLGWNSLKTAAVLLIGAVLVIGYVIVMNS